MAKAKIVKKNAGKVQLTLSQKEAYKLYHLLTDITDNHTDNIFWAINAVIGEVDEPEKWSLHQWKFSNAGAEWTDES